MLAHFCGRLLFLQVKDHNIGDAYLNSVRPTANMMGIFLLLMRLISLMYREFAFDSLSECARNPGYVVTAMGLPMVGLVFSMRWQLGTQLLAFFTVAGSMSLSFCSDDIQEEDDQGGLIADTLAFDVLSSILLSVAWIPTALISLVLKGTLY